VTATLLLLVLLLLVAILVGAYVLWPLLQRPAGARPGADAAQVSRQVLRERRRELEAALAHLPADAPERRAALAEFAEQADAELVDDGPASPPTADAPARRPWTAAALAVMLAVPTFGLYLSAGAPDLVAPELLQQAGREPATLDELVADLRRRLEADPSQGEGWRMLGRAELARGRPDDARQAFERALALDPKDAQLRADLADALAQSQGAVLEGRPIALIREALSIDPRNPKALALAGAYEVTQKNFPAAIGHWKALLAVLPADSEQARQVSAFVADLEAGRPPTVPQRAGPAPGGPAPGETVAGAGAPGGSALTGRIEIERSLAAKLRPDDTLFVVARRIDDAGRPSGPPLAVLRGRGADLPLAFTLDDRLAMSPAANLSSLPADAQVVVIARLSRTGEAAAKPGDLQGASQPVRPGTGGLRVLIDAELE
jgi:cytochrome c-type biogenesis protein CcmH